MHRRTRRGLVLSESGIARVNRARRRLEIEQNDGGRITLDRLGCDAGLSPKTMSRLFSRDVPVDRRTIELLFEELGLTLQDDDVSPPAARLLAERSQLPHYRTIMFGRDEELARLDDFARERMIVTLTGTGGVGKTRLAVEWMTRVKHAYSHIAFLDLTLLTDKTTLREGIRTLLDGTAAGENVLIVLDGCEHLVEAAATTASELLDTMPHLSVLATSREPLGVAGEAVVRLAPLRVPDATILRSGNAFDAPAFGMFVERARSFDDHFALGAETIPVVAEIVRRLDGIPLALELAAARAAFMSPGDLLASLSDHLGVLSEGLRRLGIPRHRSARALIDWSYQLLTLDERAIFQALSAFMGTFDAVAVAAICSDRFTARAVREMLTELVRKSLVIVDASGRATRFRVLETIRQYAAEKLAESGGDSHTRQVHALYYFDVSRSSVAAGTTTNSEASLHELQIELPNLREALKWATEVTRNAYLAAAISAHLIDFWEARGEVVEAEHWLRRSLQSSTELVTEANRARVHEGIALSTYRRGQLKEAFEEASIALTHYASLNDVAGLRRVRNVLGLTAMDGGDAVAAREYFETNLEEGRAMRDPRAVSVSLNNLGRLRAEREGDLERAMPLFAESLATARESGLRSQILLPLANLSECALELGRYTAGLTYAQLGIAEAEKLGNREAAAGLALQSVTHALHIGGLQAAREPAILAAEAIAEIPYRTAIAAGLCDIGRALEVTGEPLRAATIFDATDAYRRRGEALRTIVASEIGSAARSGFLDVLGSGEGAALYTKGEMLTLYDAFREAFRSQLNNVSSIPTSET